MSTQSIVIIPTYNELENVDKMTRAVMRLNKVDILYVDDNSPDGTFLNCNPNISGVLLSSPPYEF